MSNLFKTFRQSDADAMKEVERELVKTALPFRERMPPALVAMALLRMTRTVLRLCNPNDQKELLPIFVAFLEGKINPPDSGSFLWTPDEKVM
jgi:hypothetical protein